VAPTFVLDREGNVTIWNEACEKLTGLPASAITGARTIGRGFYLAARLCLADLAFRGGDPSIA
jgi:PAS domain-containing protein